MSTTAITITVIVTILLSIIVWLKVKSGKVTEYFKNAVTAYLWLEDTSARLAALTSAKVAAAVQRKAMVSHLTQLPGQLAPFYDKIPELQVLRTRLEKLAQELSQKIVATNWTMQDIREAKAELGETNPEYLKALNQFDPSVFVSRYPTLFQASNILELVQAAVQIKRTEVEHGVEVMEKLKNLKEFQDPKIKAILDQGIEQAKKDLSS